jgi:hypothetical protein
MKRQDLAKWILRKPICVGITLILAVLFQPLNTQIAFGDKCNGFWWVLCICTESVHY